MMVKQSARVNNLSGHWWITKTEARKLCNNVLPAMGREKVVHKSKRDQVWPFGTVVVEDCVYVANISGRFQIRDNNRSFVQEVS